MKNFISKNILYLIYIFYFVFIFLIFFYSERSISGVNFSNGYLLGNDSFRYIDGANNILNFTVPDSNKGISYLGYIFILVPFQYFKLDLTYVVIFQIFLTLISSYCLYKISKELSSPLGGIISLTFYLFYFPLQIYNLYILTETIFICTIIFIIYFIVFYKKKFLSILIFLLILFLLLRPHGILIIPIIVLSLGFWSIIEKDTKIFYALIFVLLIIAYPSFLLLNYYLETESMISQIANMGIIVGYENPNNLLNFTQPLNENNDLFSLLSYLKNNMVVFFESFYKKIYFFLIRIRPYYSELHNLYLILFNLLYYPLAIYGVLKFELKNKIYYYFMLLYIFVFTVSIGFSFADWDSRYSLYILPLIFIFSGVGFSHIEKTKFIKKLLNN